MQVISGTDLRNFIDAGPPQTKPVTVGLFGEKSLEVIGRLNSVGLLVVAWPAPPV